MDELEIQVALAPIRIRLCSGLQIVPVVFSTVEILKTDNMNETGRTVRSEIADIEIRIFSTCSFRTTFPKKSSWPFSFLASLIILNRYKKKSSPALFGHLFVPKERVIPSQTVKVGFDLL